MTIQFFTTEKIGPKQEKTPEGYLLCREVPIARTGAMSYLQGGMPLDGLGRPISTDREIEVVRDAMALFSEESLSSLQGKSLVHDHPKQDIDPTSWKKLTLGIVMNPRRGDNANDDLLMADILVTTEEGMKKIQEGKREVSAGYDAEYEEISPGKWRQHRIIFNHVALVEQGRCGSRCRIQDSIEEPIFMSEDMKEEENTPKEESVSEVKTEDNVVPKEEENPMAKAMDALSITMGSLVARMDAIEEKMSAATKDKVPEVNKEEEKVEEKEEEKKEVAETKDSACLVDASTQDSSSLQDPFQAMLAKAEIISPGIPLVSFHTRDSLEDTKNRMIEFQSKSLIEAHRLPVTRKIMEEILGTPRLHLAGMTRDSIEVLFNSTVLAKKMSNNAPLVAIPVTSHIPKELTLADINRINADFYRNHP